MNSKLDSIDASSKVNPYQPPSVDDAPSFVFRPLLHWLTARSMAGLICFTLATVILLGWAAVFEIHRFMIVSWLLLSLGIMTAAVSIIVRNWSGVAFGLSAAGTCLFCDFVIYYVTAGRPLLMRGAHHAAELLRPIVVLYACVAIPVGGFILLYQLTRSPHRRSKKSATE
jgi:hypothetical protein